MICIQCGNPVNEILQQFSKGNIRLSQCDHCHKIADKYVEYDFVIIFLDLILHRFQVYRHILFNKTDYVDRGISINYLKIFIVYVFFDAYILNKDVHMRLKELYESGDPADQCAFNEVEKPHERYLFILFTAALEFIVYITAIVLTAKLTMKSVSNVQYAIIKWNYLVMAIILSSFGKGFIFLMMIWDYDDKFSNFSLIIDLFIFTSNLLAIKVFLDVGTLKAVSLIIIGLAVKILFQIITYIFFYDVLKILCILDVCI